jgi:hypothetical protein
MYLASLIRLASAVSEILPVNKNFLITHINAVSLRVRYKNYLTDNYMQLSQATTEFDNK